MLYRDNYCEIEMRRRTLVLLLDVGVHIYRGDATEEFYVFVRVKLGHFPLGGGFGSL